MRAPLASGRPLPYGGAMRRRAYVLGGLLVTVLLTTLVLSTASSQPLMGASRPLTAARADPPPPRTPKLGSPRNRVDANAFPHWLVVVATVLLLLYASSLLALLVMSRRGRKAPPRDDQPGGAEDPPAGGWQTLLGVELAEAAQEQMGEIGLGTPRNAIIACWLRLHTATRRAGLAASPSDTPQEFTARAMHQLSLDGEAITALGDLYREARFSEHPITETQRERAAAALAVLADQLAAVPVLR